MELLQDFLIISKNHFFNKNRNIELQKQGQTQNLRQIEQKNQTYEEKERLQKLYEKIEDLGKAHKPFDRKKPDDKTVLELLGLNFSDKEIDDLMANPKMTNKDVEILLSMRKDKFKEKQKNESKGATNSDNQKPSDDKKSPDNTTTKLEGNIFFKKIIFSRILY